MLRESPYELDLHLYTECRKWVDQQLLHGAAFI